MGKKAPNTFQRKLEDDEVEETFLEWLTGKFNEKFIENIPSDSIRDLPSRYILPVGTLAYLASTFCFAYFIYVGYTTARKQQFISLDADDGECKVVATVVDGTYYGSKYGMWGGEPDFKFTEAPYRVDLQHYKNSEEEYSHQMNELVYPQLKLLAEVAVRSDAVVNMLNWMSWSTRLRPDLEGDHNIFQMTGNPRIVFNRQYFFGLYSGLQGDCLLHGDSQYNEVDGKMSLLYNYSDFVRDPVCSTIAAPTHMGFVSDYDFDFFRTKVDISSVITCVAVNLGTLPFQELDVIEGSRTLSHSKNSNLTVSWSQRFDFRYPGMDPVFCAEAAVLNHAVCFLKMGDTLAIPLINHYGTGRDAPEACNCSTPGHGDKNSSCQVFDFMVGALFFNGVSSFFGDEWVGYENASDIALLRLMQRFSIEDITRMAYNISYAAIEYGEYLDPAWRAEAYSFCTLKGIGACSLLMFNTYGEEINSVSEFYFQVPYPACHDSFLVHDDNWHALASHPPVDLVQEYFACKSTVYDALFTSIGIASGNTATFVPIFMLVLLPLIYLYLSSSGNLPPKKEYDEEDLTKATKAFATALLRVRDGKVRGMKRGGTLISVAAELIASAAEVAAFPDSDDDESDDEAEGSAGSLRSGQQRLTGTVYTMKHYAEEGGNDEHFSTASPSPREVQTDSGAGFFSTVFSSGAKPLQEQEHGPGTGLAQERDMEMAVTHKRPAAKRKTKATTRILILNQLEALSGSRSSSSRGGGAGARMMGPSEAAGSAAAVLEGLRRARKVHGLDGADGVFNQAVRAAAELRNVDLTLLRGADASSLFKVLYEAALLHASLSTGRDESRLTSASEAGKLAYRVGERVFSLLDLRALSLDSALEQASLQSLGFRPE